MTWAILVLLGALLLLVAIAWEGFFFKGNQPVKVAAFFGIQLILCGIINYLGQAQFWLLYLPFASVAASVLSRKGLAVFCLIVLVLFCLPLRFQNPSLLAQWVLIFLCALVFVLIFTEVSVRDQQTRREVERLARELEQANQRLREYAAQAGELARTRERNRLAREIHDSLGHYLTVIHVQIEAARALAENRGWKELAPELYVALEKAQNLAHSGLTDVRKSVAALRAGPLDDLPFLDALKNLVAECQEAGLVAHLHLEGEARALSPQTELALYRTAQEALTNVRKHARASRVDISLAFTPDTVRLEIRDNGIGLDLEAKSNDTFGLLGIRERAEILHGTVALQTAPGDGFRLVLEIPLTK